jgi:hypothetical protein
VLEEKELFLSSLHHHYSLMERNHTEDIYVETMQLALAGGGLNE